MTAVSLRTRRWINGAAFLLVVAVNGLANAIPLFGVKTEDVSRMVDNLFTPAPVTFAVWGVIYALLAGFTLFQAGAFRHERSGEAAERVGWWFAGSCVLNALWMICWHARQTGLCALLMVALMVTLAVLSGRVGDFHRDWKETWLVRAPFSLYFGWVTIAALAGMAAWLTQIGWRGFGLTDEAWTVIVALLGLAVTLTTVFRRQDSLYGLAAAWGYGGLTMRHLSANGFGGAYPFAATVLGAGCLVLLAAAGIVFLRRRT